jgi:type IX secretion system PorP/SprF family membrane protein
LDPVTEIKQKAMRVKIFCLILCSTVACLSVNAQQAVQFSQYVFNGLAVNPAYAGYRGDAYLNATYRKQWVDFPGAPQTGIVSLDGLPNWVQGERVGLGIQAQWDKMGPQEYLSIAGSYAYRIPLNESGSSRLSIGMGLSLAQYSVKGNVLQLTEVNDPAAPQGRINSLSPDASFGVYYNTSSFYAGVSILQLFSQEMSGKIAIAGGDREYLVIKRTKHYYFTSGFLVDLSDQLKLKPSIMVKEDFKGPTSFDLNAFLLLNEKLWIGGSYRSSANIWKKTSLQDGLMKSNAASAILEFFANDRLRIGYSYDFTTSGLSSYQSGSHEISIGLLLLGKKRQDRVLSPRYF